MCYGLSRLKLNEVFTWDDNIGAKFGARLRVLYGERERGFLSI